jgi:hypothetical protein
MAKPALIKLEIAIIKIRKKKSIKKMKIDQIKRLSTQNKQINT